MAENQSTEVAGPSTLGSMSRYRIGSPPSSGVVRGITPVVLVLAAVLISACHGTRHASTREGPLRPVPAVQAAPARGMEPAVEPGPGARQGPHPDGLLYFAQKRLAEGESQPPAEGYERAWQQLAEMRRQQKSRGGRGAARLGGAWEPLGPGNIGGRTRALVIDPANPAVLYAGTASGGVWKTENGGASWRPLADRLASLTVNALAMDPADSKVLYAGTGEGYLIGNPGGVNTSGLLRGLGIFKTADGGESWSRLERTANSNFWYVNDLAVSRIDSRRIYATTESGMWLSRDAGETWSLVHNPQLSGGCTDLAVRAGTPGDYLFAVCGATTAQILRNTDAGGSGQWTVVHAEPGMARTSLAIAPSNPDTVYAVSSQATPGAFNWALFAVYRSTQGGDPGSWEARVRHTDPVKMNRAILSHPGQAFATNCGLGNADVFAGWSYHNLSIAVDPKDENRVWTGAIEIYRSDDGGANWGMAGPGFVPNSGPAGVHVIHPDHHAIVFDPGYDGEGNQTMYVANDGGVYRTGNARAATGGSAAAACGGAPIELRWQALNTDFAATQFYHGVALPDGSGYFGGTQDNGTLVGSEAGGPNGWRGILMGDGAPAAVDWSNPRTMYVQSQNRNLRKSTDGGRTLSAAVFGISDTAFFMNPIALDPSDPRRLWTSGNLLWRTDNGAGAWAQASAPPVAGASVITALAVAPSDPNVVLAGRFDGSILRTSQALTADSQTAWEVSRPRSGFVSSLTFDPADRAVVYATYSWFGGVKVWRSGNGGATWTPLDGVGPGALPDMPVHSLAVDPADSRRLFLGTDLGIFVSTDGGQSWEPEDNGFPNVITETLAIQVENGRTRLYAFTHGRGAWRVTLGESGCSNRLSAATVAVTAAGGDGRFEVEGGCPWRAESNADWISAAVDGERAVRYTVAANPGVAARAGTVSVGGRGFTVRQAGRPDETAPVLRIDAPSGDGVFATAAESIDVAGSVSDDGTLVATEWSSDRGGGGALPGGATWRIPAIALLPGRNVITVTATDLAGNSGSAQLAIDRTSGSGDGTPPELAITTPDSAAATVTGGSVALAGTASDDTAVAQVRWRNDRGGAGAATGTNAWTARVPLMAGRNVITVTAWDSAGNSRSAAVEITAQLERTITTLAGNGLRDEGVDGVPATQSPFLVPFNVAVERDGSVLVADSRNNRVRRVTPDGIARPVAGSGTLGLDLRDEDARQAAMSSPRGLAVDDAGNVIVVESLNRVIRKITPEGRLIHVAGNGQEGFAGDGGAATSARLLNPNMVAVGPGGDLFFTDLANHRVRRIDAAGVITTVAGLGMPGRSGDGGPASEARIPSPLGLALDANGDLYVSEPTTHTIRRVSRDGVVSTVAGTGAPGFSGDGGPGTAAQLNVPFGLALHAGRLYIADQANHRVRALDLATGILTTFAGSGQLGFSGDSGAPENAQLAFPTGVAVDAAGNVYIADQGNGRVRQVRRAPL